MLHMVLPKCRGHTNTGCVAKLTAGLNLPPLMSAKMATLMAREIPKAKAMYKSFPTSGMGFELAVKSLVPAALSAI